MNEDDIAQLAQLAGAIRDLSHQLDIRFSPLAEELHLNGTEIAVIRSIHRDPGITPTGVAEKTGVKKSNVSTALRVLEAAGLVAREITGKSARSYSLKPTRKSIRYMVMIEQYWAEKLLQGDPRAIERLLESGDALRRLSDSLPSSAP